MTDSSRMVPIRQLHANYTQLPENGDKIKNLEMENINPKD